MKLLSREVTDHLRGDMTEKELQLIMAITRECCLLPLRMMKEANLPYSRAVELMPSIIVMTLAGRCHATWDSPVEQAMNFENIVDQTRKLLTEVIDV